MLTTKTGACVTVLALASAAVAAQPQTAERLSTARRLNCLFSVVATGTWIDGAAEASVKPAKLTLDFDTIDADGGTARVLGDFGPSEIIVRRAGTTLHFLQSFRDGPLYLTTVFVKETRSGRLQATHTRHEYTDVSLPGFTSRPEQYYGECEVQP
jgi:hypothetical protein